MEERCKCSNTIVCRMALMDYLYLYFGIERWNGAMMAGEPEFLGWRMETSGAEI